MSAVLADSPIHYWRTNTGGFLADVATSPHARNHMLMDPELNPLSFTGICTGGQSWMHQDSFFASSRVPEVGGAPISLECWAWWAFKGTSARATMMGWDGATLGANFAIDNTTQKARIGYAGGSLLSTNPLTFQSWHHIVTTLSAAGTLKLYVDNAVAGSTAIGAPGGWTAGFNIGLDGVGGANPFFGFLTECAIYLSELSSGQVATHFAAADAIVNPPGYAGAPPQSVFTTAVDPTSLLDDILSAVRRTFPATS
jgi:hypothetical protein